MHEYRQYIFVRIPWESVFLSESIWVRSRHRFGPYLNSDFDHGQLGRTVGVAKVIWIAVKRLYLLYYTAFVNHRSLIKPRWYTLQIGAETGPKLCSRNPTAEILPAKCKLSCSLRIDPLYYGNVVGNNEYPNTQHISAQIWNKFKQLLLQNIPWIELERKTMESSQSWAKPSIWLCISPPSVFPTLGGPIGHGISMGILHSVTFNIWSSDKHSRRPAFNHCAVCSYVIIRPTLQWLLIVTACNWKGQQNRNHIYK